MSGILDFPEMFPWLRRQGDRLLNQGFVRFVESERCVVVESELGLVR